MIQMMNGLAVAIAYRTDIKIERLNLANQLAWFKIRFQGITPGELIDLRDFHKRLSVYLIPTRIHRNMSKTSLLHRAADYCCSREFDKVFDTFVQENVHVFMVRVVYLNGYIIYLN